MATKPGPFPAFETEDSIDNDLGLNLPTWQPSFDAQQTKTYVKEYEKNPRQFQPQMLRVLNKHAKHHRVPFAYNPEDNNASIGSIVKNLGGGFVEGFTTLGIPGDTKPKNEWDAIARNLGHLGGFLGYIPTRGVGTIAKIIRSMRGKSIPLRAGKFATDKVGKAVSNAIGTKNDSFLTSIKFFQEPVVKDLAEGALNLGVASSVASWREGIDGMMQGFVGGAATGGVFRALGNYMKVGKFLNLPQGKGGETADKIGRGLASSLFQGLPATAAGATTPEQIYEYLLGAYFGVNEMPYHRRLGAKFLQKSRLRKHRDKELETIPGWEKLDAVTKKFVLKEDAKIPKGEFMSSFLVQELRNRGLLTEIKSEKDLRKLEKKLIDNEILRQRGEEDITLKEIIETDPVFVERKEGTKSLNQDNLDFELSDTIKQKVKNYVDVELQSYVEPLPLQDKLKTFLDVQKKWDSLVDKAIENKINPEVEMREFISKKYNIDTSSDNHYNFWRSWGNSVISQEPVDIAVIELSSGAEKNKVITFDASANPVFRPGREISDKQGNEIVLLEERKLIDNLYEIAFRKKYPDAELPISVNTGKPIRAFKLVDSINLVERTNKDGSRVEKLIDLKDLESVITKKQYGVKDYNEFWNSTMSKMDKTMDQQGMYYFSGKGDAHRQYWVRYHPEIDGFTPSQIKNQVNKIITKDIKEDLKDYLKIHERPVFSKKQAEELYYKSTFSNILYGLDFNGYSYNSANAKKLFRSYDNIVVKNAKDFNKRQQIWFTSGHTPDPEFIARTVGGVGGSYALNTKNSVHKFNKTKVNVVKSIPTQRDKPILANYNSKTDTITIAQPMISQKFKEKAWTVSATQRDDSKSTPLKENTFKNEQEFYNFVILHELTHKKPGFNKPRKNETLGQLEDRVNKRALAELKIIKDNNLMDSIPESPVESFNYALVYGPETLFPNQDKLKTKDLNNRYNESEDGAIIARSDTINGLNREAGIPSEGGFNKSFMVSPNSQYGALIGKYGMHTATPKEEAWMKANNVHFIVNALSAKASGTRPYQIYDWNKNTNSYEFKDVKINSQGKIIQTTKAAPRLFQMPVQDVKTVTSEIVSDKTLTQNIRLYKQIFTNLTPYAFNKVAQKDIDDMFQGTVIKRFNGDELANQRMDKFLSDPNKFRGEIDLLIRDMDKISIDRFLDGMKNNTEAGHEFASQAYQRILRVNKKIEQDNLLEGGETRENVTEEIRKIQDFESIHERILRVTGTNLSGALHKFVTPMRGAAIRNYVINELTRPVIGNSTSVRLRPYTPAMKDIKDEQGNLSRLQKDDTIFFLDNGFKTYEIQTAWRKKPYTLSELWDAVRTNKKNFPVKEAKEILRAFAVRVPMDSMSGGAALDFAGFTGAPGLGGLVHARTAKKLGGADLDGDKAGIYFGDEVHGFHKRWKDMFAKQAKEFEKADGTTIDNKIARAEFAVTDKTKEGERILKMLNSPSLAYSPLQRRLASQAAAIGRDRLGVAVSLRANLVAAHAAIADLPKRTVKIRGKEVEVKAGEFVYEVYNKENKPVLITVKAKTDPKDLELFRLRARTAIALGSDPMDEAGLKAVEVFRNAMSEPLFSWKVKGIKEEFLSKKDEMETDDKMKFVYAFSNVNSALYGRNYKQNRRYFYNEIQSKIDYLLNSSETGKDKLFFEGITQRNTLLPKMAETIKPLDFSDSIYKRIKQKELQDIYTEYGKLIKTKEYSWLKEVLNRSTLATPSGIHMQRMFEYELFTSEGYKKQLSDNNKGYIKNLFDNYDPITKTDSYKSYVKKGLVSQNLINARERHLNEYIKFNEDAIVNDLADMTSVQLIRQFADRVGDPDRILRIHRDSENFKKRGSIIYKGFEESANKIREDLEAPIDREVGQQIYKEIIKLTEKDAAITKRSQLDSLISKYKQGLKTKDERDLFDHFMLGTLNRGQQDRVDKLIKKQLKNKTLSPLLKEKLKDFQEQSAGTSLLRLGFSSPSISESNIKLYFDKYSKLFETAVAFPKKDVTRIQKESDRAAEEQFIVDANGNVLKGNPISTNNLDAKTKKYIDEIAPFLGLTEGKLNKEESRIAMEVIDHIQHYFGANPLPGTQLNGLARALVNKDLNNMNFKDFELFNNYLKDFREGNYIAKLFQAAKYFPEYGKDPSKTLKGFPELGRRFYLLFPEAVNKELMMHEIMLVNKRGIWKDKRGNVVTGTVKAPTQIINEIRDMHHYAQQTITSSFEDQMRKMDDEMSPFYALEEGPAFHRVAATMMERFGEVRMANNLNKEPVGDYLSRERLKLKPNQRKSLDIVYADHFRKTIESADWFNIRDKAYVVNLPGGPKKMTGAEITQEMIKVIAKKNSRYSTFLNGKEGAADKYLKGIELARTPEEKIDALNKMRDTFLSDIQNSINKGEPISMELGMDNLRLITKYLQLKQIKDQFPGKDIFAKKNVGTVVRGEVIATDKFLEQLDAAPSQVGKTGKIDPNYYFPHTMFDRAVAAKGLYRQIQAVLRDIDSKSGKVREEANREIKKLIIRHKQLTGDYLTNNELNSSYSEINKILSQIGQKKSKVLDEGLSNYLKNRKIGNMFSRNSHLPGWSYEPEAYNMYAKNITGAFYKQIADIASHEAIYSFRKDKTRQLGSDLANRWANYLELQSRGMSGEPVMIPEYMLNDPKMKLNGTPYAWFADNLWAKRLNKLRGSLGFRDKSRIKAELKDWDVNTLRKFGQAEARYQLATLLAHPKSSIANLYGGSVLTLQSTGLEYFRNARNINYLRSKVNKDWTSMGDVYNWVKSHGVVEDFLLYELQINPNVQTQAMKKTVQEAVQKIKKNPDFKDSSLYEIAKKNGISEKAFNAAASFMRVPERILRRDAFVAHYLKARDKFDGLITDYNDPYLIDMARKGVKGTQFLYSAPFRPPWARSTMGKVFSRFQIWAYNSVRFRNDAIREAKIYGFEGDAQKKLDRILTGDIFMLGLANMFPYSIFESALPSPWNYLQDSADLMFGDEKERDRAFFGSYPAPLQPLQAVTPPALRIFPPLFKAMVQDDYTRMADYYLWTMFPFGRIARDTVGPGGLLENPAQAVEKFTGLPYMKFASGYVKSQKELQVPTPSVFERFDEKLDDLDEL